MGGLCRFVDDELDTGGLATEDVPLVSLDTALPADRRVSVIHLDIEEYEQNALAGGLETLRRCRPVLILETEPTAGWIAENLAPLGYARQAYVDNNSVFVAAP